MQKFQTILADLEQQESALLSSNTDPAKRVVSEDYFKQLKLLIEEYPSLSCIHMKYFERYQEYLVQGGPTKEQADTLI